MKVSIITTAYNVERTISQTISSCVGQTHGDLEILVVNDASTDGTCGIVQSFIENDDRVRLITNDKNYGAGLSRRYGTKAATGDYTMFVDGDDWLEPDAVEKMLGLAVEHGSDIVSCGLRIVDGNGSLIGMSPYDRDEVVPARDSVCDNNLIRRFLNNKLIRRGIWDVVEYSGRRYIEDLQTSYYIMHRANTVVNTTECLYNYRQSPGSLTHAAGSKKDAVYQALCNMDISKFCKEHVPDKFIPSLKAVMMRIHIAGEILTNDDKVVYMEEIAELMDFVRDNREHIERLG